jgi:hypothetical protein
LPGQWRSAAGASTDQAIKVVMGADPEPNDAVFDRQSEYTPFQADACRPVRPDLFNGNEGYSEFAFSNGRLDLIELGHADIIASRRRKIDGPHASAGR